MEGIRALADQHGIVLIFDECTSGFRETFGGYHKKFNVEPDIAVFGKTLGNGYAVTSVIGTRAVMEAAQSTFISSTFWTERIGSVAALKTLEVMEETRSWDEITAIGHKVRAAWTEIAQAHGLPITITGIPALSGFRFGTERDLAYKTLISQEMLKQGWLASTLCYSCMAHDDTTITAYQEALSPVFGLIAECEDGRDVMSLLEGPVCHSGFMRLN